MPRSFARRSVAAVILTLGLTSSLTQANPLIVNAAQTLRQSIRVNVIRVADDAGGNAAPAFGTATQQAAIFGGVDTIWAQAGINVDFKFRAGTWNNSFALGTPGQTAARPNSDLNTLVGRASAAGVLDPDPDVINLFQIRVVPGFAQTSDNTSNGLAFVGGNGIGFWTGPNLPTFAEGTELVAKVLAHEIGHNMGLPHLTESQNLMQSSSPDYHEARLNASQIATAQRSSFSIVRGDATADDAVDFDDLLVLAQNYGNGSGRTRFTGDFDFDGDADFDDLLILAGNYNYAQAGSWDLPLTGYDAFDADGEIATLMVPEPVTLALPIGAVALGVTRRRR